MVDDNQKELTIYLSLLAVCTVLETVKTLHVVKSLAVYGLFLGSPTYYHDANRAQQYISNIDHHLNLLKGSPENDGLVALESQYYLRSVHGNVLLGGNEGYERFTEETHKSINPQKNEEVRDKINDMLYYVQLQRDRQSP